MDVFGPGRFMYGSDWPVATLATEYAPWLQVIRDLVDELAAAEGSDVLAGTATRVYGLAA
jgi:L-fuconolactonase